MEVIKIALFKKSVFKRFIRAFPEINFEKTIPFEKFAFDHQVFTISANMVEFLGIYKKLSFRI